MNNPFPGTRSPVNGSSAPFYNPQKEAMNPNNPMLYQNNQPSANGFVPGSNSKSFISRSNIMEMPKATNNTSAYIKNPNENPMQPGKFPNSITSPTNFGQSNKPSFPGSFPTKATNNEMVKSSFHENNGTESTSGGSRVFTSTQNSEKVPFTSNTPQRRAPRMSEGGAYEPPPFPKESSFKPPEKLGESPLIKKPKDTF